MRAETYVQYPMNDAYLLFGADAGVGRHMAPEQLRAANLMRVVVGGTESLSTAAWVLARPVARTPPGFLAMPLVGMAQPVRLSAHANSPKFRTTESFWCLDVAAEWPRHAGGSRLGSRGDSR